MSKLQIKLLSRFLLAVMIPTVIVAVLSYAFYYRQLDSYLAEQLEQSLSGLDSQLETLREDRYVNAWELASNIDLIQALRENDRQAVLDIIAQSQSLLGVESLSILSREGAVLAQTQSPAEYGQDRLTVPGVRQALTGEAVSSFLEMASGVGVHIVTPIRFQNELLGLVQLEDALDLKFARRFRQQFGLDAMILRGPHVQVTTLENTGLISLVLKALDENSGPASTEDGVIYAALEGQSHDIAVRPLLSPQGDYTGSIILVQPLSTLVSATAYLRNLYAMLILILVLTTGAVSYRMSSKIVQPVRQLSDAARDISLGNLHRNVDIEADDEIGELARSFQEMVEKRRVTEGELRQHRDHLEDLVSSRTRKLEEANKNLQKEIEDRKAAETQLGEKEIQLQHSQKMEAVGQLAGGIAHDFNNLLQALQGYTDLILGDMKPDNTHFADVQEMQGALERASSLVRQLLIFSRRDAINPEALSLTTQTLKLMKLLRRLLGERVEIDLDLKENLPPIIIDATQCEQILINLCLNATDAMNGSGRLRIETARKDREDGENAPEFSAKAKEYVRLSVSDTGAGMSEDVMLRMYEPFFSTKDVGQGTGMGLATVYGIVHQNDGFIRVDSKPGLGTTFHIYFPVTEQAVNGVQPEEPTTKTGNASGTVLLAEDETMVRNYVTRILERAGYTLLVAKDGDEAHDIYAQNSDIIDVCLLDVVMPGLPTQDVCKKIRRETPGLPIVLSSGYSFDALDDDILDYALPLLQKPYRQQALLDALRQAIESRAKSSIASDETFD